MKRRRLRHNLNDVKATTAYVTMMRTELISAPEYWIQCVFSKIFLLSRFPILFSLTRHRKLCMDMKLFVQETRSSLIKNYLFADNDVTMQLLTLYGKFVHKANCVTPELFVSNSVFLCFAFNAKHFPLGCVLLCSL